VLTRTMLLALGQETAQAIGQAVDARETALKTDATQYVYQIADSGVTSDNLLALAGIGRDLQQTERASSRLSYFNKNFATGGVAEEDKPATIRRKQREEQWKQREEREEQW
jgi:hypothetical protein